MTRSLITYVYDMETGESVPWIMSPALYRQMLGRMVRPGQTEDVSFEDRVKGLKKETQTISCVE